MKNISLKIALSTVAIFGANVAMANTYCTHVGASSVTCIGNVDCGSIPMGAGDSCFEEAHVELPEGAIMADGDQAEQIMKAIKHTVSTAEMKDLNVKGNGGGKVEVGDLMLKAKPNGKPMTKDLEIKK
ncbi:hypothetical protein [Celeribacter sp.]|uniref:hypothetical protein n=1 Tax=Celeribacter sp. TaxID=1890673 RepID=UPI003A92BFC2